MLRSAALAAVTFLLGSLVPVAAEVHTLSGCVKDLAGAPVKGGIVHIEEADTPALKYTLVTDAKGCYKQEVLPDGFYEIRVEVAGVVMARRLVTLERSLHVTANLEFSAKPLAAAPTVPPMINLKTLEAPERPRFATRPSRAGATGGQDSSLLKSVSFDQATVDAGEIVPCTVTLAAPAPEGGIVLPLRLNNPALATIPEDVAVAAGKASAWFPVSTGKVRGRYDVRLSVKVSYGGETKSAELTILSYTRLTVKMTGDGYGRVTSSPAGLQCDSGDCASPFSDGQAVRLTPLPKAGTVFGGWSGDCDGQGRVTVTGPVTCTAKFSRQ